MGCRLPWATLRFILRATVPAILAQNFLERALAGGFPGAEEFGRALWPWALRVGLALLTLLGFQLAGRILAGLIHRVGRHHDAGRADLLALFYRPFHRGDFIEVDGKTGTVLQIDLRYTTLQGEGRRILLPNATLFTTAIQVIENPPKPGAIADAKPTPATP